ncbi:hypothetical protein SALBM311S_03730 [Streptomyces alboniger]
MGNDLNQTLDEELVVGLDAGGTRTRAVLAVARADGPVVGEGAAGPGNALTVPVPQLTDHLTEAVADAVPERLRGSVVSVVGGFAGATAASPDDPGHVNARSALTAALRRLDVPTGPVGICSDIEAAFAAAPGTPADGLALVAGTGAVAMRIIDRHATATVDGDGWLLGDDGSGFWIGRAAVRAALRTADGRGPATMLAETVGRALGPSGRSGAERSVEPRRTRGLPHAPASRRDGRAHRSAVVLIQGRPHVVPDTAAALLTAWYPGPWGGEALAEVLLGIAEPTGRLPISVPRSAAQLPVYYNHKDIEYGSYVDESAEPRYSFGHGLSYTTFAYGPPRLSGHTVEVDVTNTGARYGRTVVQVYLRRLITSVWPRTLELCAFEGVGLAPGERRTVTMTVEEERWDRADTVEFRVAESARAALSAVPVVLDLRA